MSGWREVIVMASEQKLASLIHRLHCGEVIEEDVQEKYDVPSNKRNVEKKTTTTTARRRSDLERHIPFNPSLLKRHDVVDEKSVTTTVDNAPTIDEKEDYYYHGPRFGDTLEDFSPCPDLVHIARSYEDNKLNLPPPIEQSEYDRTVEILFRSSHSSK